MAKSTPKKDKTPDKVPKVKSTVNSIVRDHPLENVISGRRKRVPTERLVASLKQKPKAPVAKKGAGGKKKGTGSAAGTPKRSADKEHRGRSPGASASKKNAKSRSRSKSKKSTKADEGAEAHDGGDEAEESHVKSPKKGLNRTRTMADVIADSKKHLKGGRPKGRTRSISKSKSKGKGKKK